MHLVDVATSSHFRQQTPSNLEVPFTGHILGLASRAACGHGNNITIGIDIVVT